MNPDGVVAGPDGALWFTNRQGDSIGRITTAGTFTHHDLPAGTQPAALAFDANGAVWFTDPAASKVGRLTTGSGGGIGTCVPGSTVLCLANGRFAVEATWQTAQGDGGAAQAEPLTADTGTFWFFQSENVELLVKVLDACVPPHDRFWVFAAGLTNLEVTLRVTDTASGRIHEYRNPRGQAFIPVQDTSTFDTCP